MSVLNMIRPLMILCLAMTLGQQALAQNLFAPIARVNGDVVTEFEVQQRQRFLQVLNAPNSDRESVIEGLIDDRLRAQAVTDAGIEITQEGLDASLSDFAARANLTTDEFVQALSGAGIDRETFRDFVLNTVAWQELIRARYRRNVDVTDADIDRAMGTSTSTAGLRVLLSEIIIPAPPQRRAQVAALADQISQSQSEAEFSNFARRYSATASRGRGGRMPWTPLENLPPALHPIILGLGVGEVTAPLPITNAIALFQLRGIEETGRPTQTYSEIEYAAYYIAGGRSEAALAEANRIRGKVDVCDDLYGIAKGQPEEVLERGAKPPAEIPQDIAIELAKLDPGEVSTTLTRAEGQTLVFLMLCKRTAAANAEVSREDVRNRLRQQQLQGFANNFMAQLRADARISRL